MWNRSPFQIVVAFDKITNRHFAQALFAWLTPGSSYFQFKPHVFIKEGYLGVLWTISVLICTHLLHYYSAERLSDNSNPVYLLIPQNVYNLLIYKMFHDTTSSQKVPDVFRHKMGPQHHTSPTLLKSENKMPFLFLLPSSKPRDWWLITLLVSFEHSRPPVSPESILPFFSSLWLSQAFTSD